MHGIGERDDEDDGGKGCADAVDVESKPAHRAEGPKDGGEWPRRDEDGGGDAAEEKDSDDGGNQHADREDLEELATNPEEGLDPDGDAAREAGLNVEFREGVAGDLSQLEEDRIEFRHVLRPVVDEGDREEHGA